MSSTQPHFSRRLRWAEALDELDPKSMMRGSRADPALIPR